MYVPLTKPPVSADRFEHGLSPACARSPVPAWRAWALSGLVNSWERTLECVRGRVYQVRPYSCDTAVQWVCERYCTAMFTVLRVKT